MTINITLPEANSKFLELIEQIKTGEEVLISEAGIIIARISPISNSQLPRVTVLQIAKLPDLHRDPFDRIIIAQSEVTGMPILTIDRLIVQYDVDVVW